MRKVQDGHNKIAVAVGAVSKLGKLSHIPRPAPILAARCRVEKEVASEISRLGAIIKLVRPAEELQYRVEPI